MGSLIGFLILAIALAVVLPDVLRARRAAAPTSPPASYPYGSPALLPGGVNDPTVQNLQASIDRLAILIGSGVGGGVASAAGGAVSAGEVGAARGLGANPITPAETKQLVLNTASSGVAAGVVPSVNLGSAVGAALIGLPRGIGTGVYQAQGATEDLPGGNPIGDWFSALGSNIRNWQSSPNAVQR